MEHWKGWVKLLHLRTLSIETQEEGTHDISGCATLLSGSGPSQTTRIQSETRKHKTPATKLDEFVSSEYVE